MDRKTHSPWRPKGNMNSTLVREIMTVGVATCKPDSLVSEVARFLLEKNLEEMVVLNADGEGIGVIGYEEIVAASNHDDFASLKAEQIMREGLPELPADIPILTAAQMMRDQHIRVAYMNHHSAGLCYPAAFISYRHVLRMLAARDDEDLKDLGVGAPRPTPLEIFIQRRDEARARAGLKK
jgi:CBS domain-containing protein